MTISGKPFVCVMGLPGVGKTRLAATFYKPVFFDTEDGAGSTVEAERIINIPFNASQSMTSILDGLRLAVATVKKSTYDSAT